MTAQMFKVLFSFVPLGVHAMMDYRDFPTYPGHLPLFVDPGVPPPSFIFAKGQLTPPYDINVDVMEPAPGCNAKYASLCAVQHAIRLVTRARVAACADLAAGGQQRQLALDGITGGAFTAEGSKGFGLFAMDPNGTIIADALQPELIGQRFDGVRAASVVGQTTLLGHIDWVVSWAGGFVPHYSTRISETPVDWQSGQGPLPATAYFEACPSGERLGVAFGREPIPAVPVCDPRANGFCAVQNMERILGLTLVDYLNAKSGGEITDIAFKVGFTDHYKVGAFYLWDCELCWWGYPGPNPWRNPGPLPDTNCVMWSHGAMPGYFNGHNISQILSQPQEGTNIDKGEYTMSVLSVGAWIGGAWQDYEWYTPQLGDHHKVSLAVGVIWNNSATNLGGGMMHQPAALEKAPLCQDCSADVSWPCTATNCMHLAAHAQLEFLTPTGNWERISNDPWFGAMHEGSYDNTYVGTWPTGFYVFAFDYNGTCVADGKNPSNMGKHADLIFAGGTGADSVHSRFVLAANTGGDWVAHTLADGTSKVAYIRKQAKWGRFFYLGVAFVRARATMLDDCTSTYSEPCSEENAQALVGAVNADILAAETEEDLTNVLRSVHGRTGDYDTGATGDFQAHIYTSKWECVDTSTSDGASCPPSLSSEALYALAAMEQDRGWVTIPSTDQGGARRAYVLPTRFSKLGDATHRDLLIITFVLAAPAPQRCENNAVSGDAACPIDAQCASSGRCQCKAGFRTVFDLDLDFCGELLPARMSCIDARGLDCTGTSGNASCPSCSAGFFCPEGLPLPCPAGQFCREGAAQPALCPAGTNSEVTRAQTEESCSVCTSGSFTASGGQTACEECPAGKFTDKDGQTACKMCSLGAYQIQEGTTSCLACEDILSGAVTPFLGATEAEQCLCPKDFFLPLGSSACEPCPVGMQCVEGSDMRHLEGDEEGPYPQLLPRYWSSTSDPLSIFQCRSEQRCPGGDPGTCADNLETQSCSHCVSGYFWDGLKCNQCGEVARSSVVFPVIPLLIIPFVFLALYYLTKEPDIKLWQEWQNKSATACFILLNYYQSIDILASTQPKVPKNLSDLYATWDFTNNVMSMFKPSCAGYTSLQATMGVKSAAPLVLAFIALLVYGCSLLVARALKKPQAGMNIDRVFNIYASILYTFFSAVSAMALELFKCARNPNGLKTMTTDSSVICYSSDIWRSMMALSIICILVYVVGVLLTLIWVLRTATTRYTNQAFRTRWTFVFIKYQHNAYWWGLVFLAKNFFVNLSLVISPVPMYQCFNILMVTLVYMVFAAFVWPYRSHFCNRAEVLCSTALTVNAAIMFAFALADDMESQHTNVSLAGISTYLPLAVCGLTVMCLSIIGLQASFRVGRGDQYLQQQREETRIAVERFKASFEEAARMSAEDLAVFWNHLSDSDKWSLLQVDAVLRTETGNSIAQPSGSKGASHATPRLGTNTLESKSVLPSPREFAL